MQLRLPNLQQGCVASKAGWRQLWRVHLLFEWVWWSLVADACAQVLQGQWGLVADACAQVLQGQWGHVACTCAQVLQVINAPQPSPGLPDASKGNQYILSIGWLSCQLPCLLITRRSPGPGSTEINKHDHRTYTAATRPEVGARAH
jgi:hypothetical protein